jgi:hypothetical protein
VSQQESAMNYAFVYARKVSASRYVFELNSSWLISDEEPDGRLPYWEISPMGTWRRIDMVGQLKLPTLRR